MAAVVTGDDAQVAALRAFLSFDPAYEQLTRQLADDGSRLDGYGDLVWSAFDIAVRRRLGGAPAPGDMVQLAASLRISLRQQQVELDPLAMEETIRSALGGALPRHYDDRTRADVLLFMLGQLAAGPGMPEGNRHDGCRACPCSRPGTGTAVHPGPQAGLDLP